MKGRIAYSKEFIEEVKACYPGSERIQQMAESGDDFLGRYLSMETITLIHINVILAANSLEELQQEVLVLKRKNELYQWWKQESQNSLSLSRQR